MVTTVIKKNAIFFIIIAFKNRATEFKQIAFKIIKQNAAFFFVRRSWL
ncbi:MAG: hypothetical protein ACTSQI_04760 [Candidatus Helarchaeota archaeon]